MGTVHYTAKVKESRILELPEEAQELGLKPGEEVTISLDRIENNPPAPQNPLSDLLQSWIEEDATDDPEELANREAVWQEFARSINEHHSSARVIFPDVSEGDIRRS